MKKILLVTARNIDRNGGENALITGRHTAIYQKYGVATDVVFYHKDTDGSVPLAQGMRFLDCKAVGIFDKISDLVASGDYGTLVLSGRYTQRIVSFLKKIKKKYGITMIVDIHSTIREIYENAIHDLYHYLGSRYLYIYNLIALKRLLQFVDYAFVVSEESKEETTKYAGHDRVKYIKIRCGCKGSIDANENRSKRKEMRKQLGLQEDEIGFIYVGSSDPWQKYQETVDLFADIQSMGVKGKYAFYRKYTDPEKKELVGRLGEENVITRWVSSEQLADELTAFDVGVILRDDMATNRVAFPNKFSDYVHGGLCIVVSDVLKEPYRIAQEQQLPIYSDSEIRKIEVLKRIKQERDDHLDEYIEHCERVIKEDLLYMSQVEKECAAWITQAFGGV